MATSLPPNQEQALALLYEKLESIDRRQAATARAVTNLADGLSSVEQRRQKDGESASRVEAALGKLEAAVAVSKGSDLSLITASDLAGLVPKDVINMARRIQWAREKGEPEPLPGPPTELVPIHQHRRKDDVEETAQTHHHRRKDDSVTFQTDIHGETRLQTNVKVKTLAGWGVAIILGGLHIYQLIAQAVHGHR